MNLQWRLPTGAARTANRGVLRLLVVRSGLALLAAIAVAAAVVVTLAIHSAGDASSRITTASPATIRAAVVARMRAEHLYYRWVVCVRSGTDFERIPLVRCNVDFGEPHIVAYCSVLRGGRLLTSEDDPAIPCGHDDAGYSASIVQYG
jgi:hypothetical protein